jgi:hypothetical protein
VRICTASEVFAVWDVGITNTEKVKGGRASVAYEVTVIENNRTYIYRSIVSQGPDSSDVSSPRRKDLQDWSPSPILASSCPVAARIK